MREIPAKASGQPGIAAGSLLPSAREATSCGHNMGWNSAGTAVSRSELAHGRRASV